MKQIILVIILAVMCASVSAWGQRAELKKDGAGVKLQGCAPTLKNGTTLTGNSQTINVTDANCMAVYGVSDVKFRPMSTATKAGIQHTLPGGSWHVDIVSDYKFVNFSGSTGTFRSDRP